MWLGWGRLCLQAVDVLGDSICSYVSVGGYFLDFLDQGDILVFLLPYCIVTVKIYLKIVNFHSIACTHLSHEKYKFLFSTFIAFFLVSSNLVTRRIS